MSIFSLLFFTVIEAVLLNAIVNIEIDKKKVKKQKHINHLQNKSQYFKEAFDFRQCYYIATLDKYCFYERDLSTEDFYNMYS